MSPPRSLWQNSILFYTIHFNRIKLIPPYWHSQITSPKLTHPHLPFPADYIAKTFPSTPPFYRRKYDPSKHIFSSGSHRKYSRPTHENNHPRLPTPWDHITKSDPHKPTLSHRSHPQTYKLMPWWRLAISITNTGTSVNCFSAATQRTQTINRITLPRTVPT